MKVYDYPIWSTMAMLSGAFLSILIYNDQGHLNKMGERLMRFSGELKKGTTVHVPKLADSKLAAFRKSSQVGRLF